MIDQMNEELTRSFTEYEIEQALKQMKALTAPGSDEGLHSLIKQAEHLGKIRGVSLCRDGPKVSHLFLSDDSLLFCRANEQECKSVLEILDMYQQASGQQINQGKTQLFFSTNTNHNAKERVKEMLGVATVTQYEKYLGLSSFVGERKNKVSIT